MGFYHPATIVRDAERHGQAIQPIDVNRSDWLCASSPTGRCARAPLLKGLREEIGKRLEAERRAALPPWTTRAPGRARSREELARLAEIGALGSLGLERRHALWESARASRPAGRRSTPRWPIRRRPRRCGHDGGGARSGGLRGHRAYLGPHPMRCAGVRLPPKASRGPSISPAWPAAARARGGRGGRAPAAGHRQGLRFHEPRGRDGADEHHRAAEFFTRDRVLLVAEPFLLVAGRAPAARTTSSPSAPSGSGGWTWGWGVPSHDFH